MVTIQQNDIEHTYYLINNPDRQGSGSAFIIDSFFYNHLQKIDSFQGRLIKLKFFFFKKHIFEIMGVYLHANHKDQSLRVDLQNRIKTWIEPNLHKNHFLILGDFNADPQKFKISNSQRECVNWRYNLFKFFKFVKFKDISLIFHRTPKDTWHSNAQHSSRIDLAFASPNFLSYILFSHINSSVYSSDHLILTVFIDKKFFMNNPHREIINQDKLKHNKLPDNYKFFYNKMTPSNWESYHNDIINTNSHLTRAFSTNIPTNP
jgi:exonuclease III